jgi:serine protease
MRLAPLLSALAAASVVGAPSVANAADVAPGKVIVRFKRDATRHERARVQSLTGTRFGTVLPGGSRTLRIADHQSVATTLRELRAHDKVAYAVPDYKVHASAFDPNDTGRGTGWQPLQWNFAGTWGVNAPQAWDEAIAAHAPGGKGVVVAVIDSGVAYENRGPFRRAPDLGGSRFVRGYDWVGRDKHPNDEESHGTHVSGVIAQQTNNRYGVTGLAYGVKIMPLRVLDSQGNGDGSDIARAIRYAVKHHAKVVNMSVEFDTGLRAGDIPEVISALRYANKKGVTLVAASGNEGSGKVAYPARDSSVISVGASTARGCLADYSNGGSGLDLVAPGGGQDANFRGNASDRAHCRPSAPDRTIVQQTLWGDVRHFRLVGFEGTSFAAPHVSAAAALLIATKRLGAHPTPAQIKDRLQATARDLGAPGPDSHYGAGLLDVGAALAP